MSCNDVGQPNIDNSKKIGWQSKIFCNLVIFMFKLSNDQCLVDIQDQKIAKKTKYFDFENA